MEKTLLQRQLARFGACHEFVDWVAARNAREAWRECQRPDWMIWLARKVGVNSQLMVLAGCACVRTALKYVPKAERRPQQALELAERWANGRRVAKPVLREAADAAAQAADVMGTAAGSAAARAAACVATAAANADGAEAAHTAIAAIWAVAVVDVAVDETAHAHALSRPLAEVPLHSVAAALARQNLCECIRESIPFNVLREMSAASYERGNAVRAARAP